jgi:DNA-binding NarL/FixJ family response regulator
MRGASAVMKRIVLVDDHPIMRHGLAQLIALEPDLTVCAHAGTCAEGLAVVEAHHPDLAVVDLTLPDRHGLELIKDIRALHPKTQTIVLSMHDEQTFASRALRAGARGYLMKETAADMLIIAIRRVLGGGIYVSESMASVLIEQASGHRGQAGGGVDQLTDREIEVLEWIGKGQASKVIAEALCISVRTVEAHRAHLKEKLGLPDGPALVKFAVQWAEGRT